MKALVYGGPGNKSWTEVPNPVIENPTDVIVKIDTTWHSKNVKISHLKCRL